MQFALTKNVPLPPPIIQAIDKLDFLSGDALNACMQKINELATNPLQQNATYRSRAHNRGTVLHAAASAYSSDPQPIGLMRSLLTSSKNAYALEARDKYDKNVMHLAAENGAQDAIEALLDLNHALLGIRDKNGKTPFEASLAAGAKGLAAREVFYARPSNAYDAWIPTNNGISRRPPTQRHCQHCARSADV